ncbi:MAG: regulatory protein RecX [Gammaproteobacteria bacterium]|nr:regulatory protein RecX [Gammaproteobacteria bacterium]
MSGDETDKNLKSDNPDKETRAKPKSPRSVRRVAMDCLARREHSFFELKTKLQQKLPFVDPEEIQQELEKLRQQNLQNDKRFVESFIRYRKSRGFGYLHIRQDLRNRFVSESLISQHLFDDDEDWLSLVNKLISKRLPDRQTLEYGSKAHRKIVRFLNSRGFQLALTQAVLAKHISH